MTPIITTIHGDTHLDQNTRSSIYNGFPPMKSDHLLTSEGIPSLRGSFSLMH